MELTKLKKEIPYQWKIQAVPKNWKKWCCVAYIDARDVMDMLDEVCWPANWQSEFYQVKNTMFCRIGILIWDKWVYKCDAWSPPDDSSWEDAVIKWEPSDSFKRSAVMWWIGRFLYSKDMVWISEEDYNANKYKLTEFCNKKNWYTVKDEWLTYEDYIDSIKMEKDTEHIKILFHQCEDSIRMSEYQLEVLKSEARKRTDFLNWSPKNNVLPEHLWN